MLLPCYSLLDKFAYTGVQFMSRTIPGAHSEPMDKNDSILRTKMPELDFIRGLAILMVVFYHGFFWSNNLEGLFGIARSFVWLTSFGWLGVNLFFILSGFLITGILIDSKGAPNYFRNFYLRRAFRILPAFYALLAVFAFLPSQNKSYLLLSFFYLSNIAPLLHVKDTYAMFWSLAVEEHFYLFWPLLIWLAPKKVLTYLALGLFVVSPMLRVAFFRDPLPTGFSGFTWLVLDGFAGGAILSILVREPAFTRKKLAVAGLLTLIVAIALLVCGAPFGILSRRRLAGAAFMLTAAYFLFFGILSITLHIGTGASRRWVNSAVLRFYGKISYGLYLIHWMVFVVFDSLSYRYLPRAANFHGNFGLLLLRFVVVLGIATGTAWLCGVYFEEPFLRLKNRFA
ncbi:MAG: acyltransferase [Candidatus Acidiferrum sp.]